MIRVKTFSCPLRVFHVHEEIESLDDKVNLFLREQGVERVVSVSDACTTDDSGASIGIVRVVACDLASAFRTRSTSSFRAATISSWAVALSVSARRMSLWRSHWNDQFSMA